MMSKSLWDTDVMQSLFCNWKTLLSFWKLRCCPTPRMLPNTMLKLGRNCTNTTSIRLVGCGVNWAAFARDWLVWRVLISASSANSFQGVCHCSLDLFCHHLFITTSQGIVICFSVSQLYRVYSAPCRCKRISDCLICVLWVRQSAKISDCVLQWRINELMFFLEIR